MLRRFALLLLFPVLVAPAAAITITGFTPSSGQPGNLVTITGTGFTSATTVAFNNAAPTFAAFMINSSTQLVAVVPLGATTGLLAVNGVASSGTFTVAPAITGFSPQTGASPTVVYINGANFVTNGTTVTFTGAAPVNGTVTAPSVVGATVPSGAQTGPITVTTSAGSATSTSNFTAGTMPTISSFSPVVGTNGTMVTIFGGNFFGSPSVTFNGTGAAVTILSATELNATVPAGAKTGPIAVTTSYGTATTTSNFITSPGPIITSFSPTVASVGMTVTVYGYNLSTVTNVTINGVKETLGGYGSGYMNVDISAASGTGPISVTSPQGSFTTSSNFSSGTGPVIGGFSPTTGGPGINVVITGLSFTGATAVKFNGTASSYSVPASTEIIATVPSGATTGPISVTTSSGTFTTGSNFFVTGSAPVITSFNPTNGVSGTVVTLNGANFTNVSSVSFGGVTGSFTPPTSTTVLYATVPLNAVSGLITVNASSGAGNSGSLFYVQPWITNATPSGIVNSSLVISGQNLTNTRSVSVGGVNYPTFTSSQNQIVATVPSNAVSGTITITAPGGVFISTNSFVVLPKIYSFTPTIGPAGTQVTIGGTSLYDVTRVEFNGVSATPYNVTTNQLQVNVPTGATPGPITVVTSGGNDVSTNNFTATYASAVDLIKTVSPVITGPGSNVTYTLVVTNLGPSAVTSLTITDNIPNGFNFGSATTTMGTVLYTNQILTATVPVLSNNAAVTVKVYGTSSSVGGLTNVAGIGFAEGETIYGSNYASAVVYFLATNARTLSISRAGSNGQVAISWPLSGAPFTLQVNTNLADSSGWQATSNAPFVTNGVNTYTNGPPFLPMQFFRLFGP
jgi:hypothetical protein